MKNVLVKFAPTALTLTLILACLLFSTQDGFAQRTTYYKNLNSSKTKNGLNPIFVLFISVNYKPKTGQRTITIINKRKWDLTRS